MKVLITGGAGFIGSHLVEQLLAAGNSVRVLDNLSTGKRSNLPTHSQLEFIQGDIRDRSLVLDSVRGVQAIVHLAAVASVQASVDDPTGTHETNFDGTLHLLEAARKEQIRRFLYASSAAVYGDNTRLPLVEDEILNPLSPYAADKLAGEYYLRFYHAKFGIETTAFRFFNIFGPRQDPSSPYSGVISIFVERVSQDEPVTLFGDGRQTRDFV
jgi:UDP-glucose 4-epimerase